jgi:hypothetical protein
MRRPEAAVVVLMKSRLSIWYGLSSFGELGCISLRIGPFYCGLCFYCGGRAFQGP